MGKPNAFKKVNTCDACGVQIIYPQTKEKHFQSAHPEFKFHMVKRPSQNGYKICCDVCQKSVDSYASLVKRHRHEGVKKTGSFINHLSSLPKPQPLEVLDGFFSNLDLLTKRLERYNVLEKKIGEYAAKISELQELLARRE